MSIEVVGWALTAQGVEDAEERMVLVGIANHAHADGTSSFPAQATIARYACCSERTVRRRLVELETKGLISRGDQDLVSHIRADRRPVVWNLAYEPYGRSDRHPVEATAGHARQNGRSRQAERPVTGGRQTVLNRKEPREVSNETKRNGKPNDALAKIRSFDADKAKPEAVANTIADIRSKLGGGE